jgi:hypothetical protein
VVGGTLRVGVNGRIHNSSVEPIGFLTSRHVKKVACPDGWCSVLDTPQKIWGRQRISASSWGVAVGPRSPGSAPRPWGQVDPNCPAVACCQASLPKGRPRRNDRRPTDGAVQHVADETDCVHAFSSWHAP